MISFGEEFRIRATPSPELLLRLAYLEAIGSDSVLTGRKSDRAGGHRARADEADAELDSMVQMARLADPGYQALSERINTDLDVMDEAAVRALQEIEEELLELRREREEMLEQAYRDEEGRHVFMTADETAAYYEDGTQLADEQFAALRERLRGRPTWEEWQDNVERQERLDTERDQIHAHDTQREQLREDLVTGAVSEGEAERRARELEDSQPDRVRRAHDAAIDTSLSIEEDALLNARTELREDAPADPAENDQPSSQVQLGLGSPGPGPS